MRGNRMGVVGATLAALVLSGCGEDPGVEQGSVPYKGTSTESLKALSNEMKRKTQEQVKKDEKEKAGEAKDRAADKATKPAAPESKPAVKGE